MVSFTYVSVGTIVSSCFIFLHFLGNQAAGDSERERDEPSVMLLALERSGSTSIDSTSTAERTLSGSLDTNSLLSVFTEFRRLSLLYLPLRLAHRPSFASIGVFESEFSISESHHRHPNPSLVLSVSLAYISHETNKSILSLSLSRTPYKTI